MSETESVRTREWGNINVNAKEYEKSMDAFEQGNLPKRVLAFTSKKLLTLFKTNLTGRSSLDGTFKSIPVL